MVCEQCGKLDFLEKRTKNLKTYVDNACNTKDFLFILWFTVIICE